MATTNTCSICGHQQPATSPFCAQCGNPMPGLGTGRLSPNSMLQGRYIIVKKIGQGGMGAVYQAADQRITGRLWAIKEMSMSLLNTPAAQTQAIQGFQQEASMLARLDHPNLPKVSDFFQEGGRYYLVMDFIEGQTLEQKLDSQGRQPFPETQVLDWAEQLCDVLEYLHNQSPPVIFRDLKPDNIIVTLDGKVKLIDFGIARHFKPGKTGDTQAMGTPGYAPPEQHGSRQTDARSDVYALGVTLHHLLTCYDPAQTPFSLPPARQLNPTVSSRLEQVITKATQTDAARRYQNIGEMRRALGGTPLSSTLPVPQPARGLPVSTKFMGVIVALLLVFGLGIAVTYTWANRTHATPTVPIAALVTPIQTPIDSPTIALMPDGASTPSTPVRALPTATSTRSLPTATLTTVKQALAPPTATPTHSPTETPTLAPCDMAVDPQLSVEWDRSELGCPQTQANIIWAAWQPFEGGYMLWRSDTGRIAVLYHDGTWADFPDQWTEGAFIPSRGSPPAGRLAPVRGFGYVWGHHDEVADQLGWAWEDEKGFCANVQVFDRGFIFHSSTILHCQGELYNWATHPDFAPLFFSVRGDGHWQLHR